MPKKETSAEVSAIAAKYMEFSPADLINIITDVLQFADGQPGFEFRNLCKDIRTLAASCLSQDETPPNA